MTSRALLRVVTPLALAALALSSCGSTQTSASGIPSLNGSNSGAGAATTTTIDPQKAAQQYVTCLRGQGLNVADPKVGADGQIDFRSIFQSANIDRGSDTFRAAQTKCGDKLRNAGFGPSTADRKQRQAAQLAFTACLRKQGLAVGDLPAGRGSGGGGAGPGGDNAGPPAGGGATTVPGAAGATTTTISGNTGGDGGPRQPQTEAEREQRLAQRLGLDISDPKVSAAFKSCSSELAAINASRSGGRTTTTTIG